MCGKHINKELFEYYRRRFTPKKVSPHSDEELMRELVREKEHEQAQEYEDEMRATRGDYNEE